MIIISRRRLIDRNKRIFLDIIEYAKIGIVKIDETPPMPSMQQKHTRL